MEDKVTLFITSCGRPDLLLVTLHSFLKFNTYPIEEAIICEDSGYDKINDFVKAILPFPCRLIYNKTRIGQMKSIENGVQYIKTPYVFHCEEDWEFYDHGFIEKSLEILKKDANITSVWLREAKEMFQRYSFNFIKAENESYYKVIANGTHGYFSFNPGLRTIEIQKTGMPYPLEERFDEGHLNTYFKNKEMYAVIINPNGFVRHIGWDRHIKNKDE
jgi:hypothetical protein